MESFYTCHVNFSVTSAAPPRLQWVGPMMIELFEPKVQSITYFSCRPPYDVFIESSKSSQDPRGCSAEPGHERLSSGHRHQSSLLNNNNWWRIVPFSECN